MNTICSRCNYDVGEFPCTVELDTIHRTLFCPACGTSVDDLNESPEDGIFFDRDSRHFLKWVAVEVPEMLQTLGPKAFGGQKLIIKVRTHTRGYREIFYDAVLLFMNNGQIIPQQMFAKPEDCRRYGIQIISRQLNAQRNFVEVEFRLKGSDEIFSVTIAAMPTESITESNGEVKDGSALKVWPRFKRDRWRDYFVYFATTDPLVATTQIRIVGKPDEVKIVPGSTPRDKLPFAPSFIEISARVKNTLGVGKPCSASFEVGLTELKTSAEGQPCLLSVDFGTSSTCFSYSSLGEAAHSLDLSDKTLTLIPGLQIEKFLAHTWLPELDKEKLLPTELLFYVPPERAFSEKKTFAAIVDYTIPPNRWRTDEEKQIVTGFKWLHAVKPVPVKQHYQSFQQMYLELVLKLAVAELAEITQGNTSIDPFHIDMVVTYPLAMLEADFQKLLDSYAAVQARVAESTGIILEERATVDESRAGQYATQPTGGRDFVFLDVGGGTTDMAVVEISAFGRETKFVDSIQYAGNDYLEAIAADTLDNNISRASLIELERRIRVKDDNVLNDLSTFKSMAHLRNQAIQALERFLDGLVEYLARTLVIQHAKDNGENAQARPSDIYLLGNGWRYVSMLVTNNNTIGVADITIQVRDWISERLRKRLEALQAAGVINSIPPYNIYHPVDPKTVVSSGALDLYMNAPETLGELGIQSEKHTFLGCNIRVTSPGINEPFDWQRKVPLKLTVAPEAIFMREPLAGFEQIEVPDKQGDITTMRNLQNVNIIGDMRDRRQLRIIKSAFSVYMEKWHKRWLNPRGWL